VYVVGGGNSAGQAGLYLARFATQVKMLIRGPNLAATISSYLVNKIANTANIQVFPNTSVVGLFGDKTLEKIVVADGTGARRELDCRHLFVCIGGTPNNAWSRDTRLIRDEAGYFVTGADLYDYENPIKTWKLKRAPYYLETNIAGVFAIGDVRHNSIKRFASAVGEGGVVTSLISRYLRESEQSSDFGRTDSST
jgi:thioredoxin reductase (NADPH)